jgi:hypothetical protein
MLAGITETLVGDRKFSRKNTGFEVLSSTFEEE